MPSFPVNPKRLDPYKNFKFRVKWDGQYVAGLSKMTPLKRTTEVVKHREGGDPSTSHKAPGRTEYDAFTLSRGISHDVAFEAWANMAFRQSLNADFPILSDAKKEVSRRYGVYNEEGGYSLRTTFVIDKNGIVQKIDQAKEALDPSGVVGVCQKLAKGTAD